MTWRPGVLLAAALVAGALLLACGGGGGDSDSAGFDSPEAAVQAMIDALVKKDRQAFLETVDPDFRSRPADLGVLVALSMPQLSGIEQGSIAFEALSLRSVPEDNPDYASVYVSGRVDIGGRETLVTDEPLFAVRKEGRWYVTSPSLPHFAVRLKTKPSDAHGAQMDDSRSLPGEYFPPFAGQDAVLGTSDDRAHVRNGTVIPFCAPGSPAGAVCYSSNPPTSGVHAESSAPFGILTTPLPRENLVHSMEHGGVVVWYNTSNAAVLRDLSGAVSAALARGDLVVMSPYAEMEAETIALTAWTRLDKFPTAEFNARRVDDFIRAHSRRFNPEGF